MNAKPGLLFNASLITLAAGLSACAHIDNKQAGEPIQLPLPAIEQGCGNNIAYMNSLISMNAEQYEPELERLDAKLDQSDSYCGVLHLAMLLSTPAPEVQNDSKAVKLYRKVLQMRGVNGTDQEFTEIFLAHTKQRQLLRNRIGAFDKELQKYKKENGLLKLQIEQLKSLEAEIEKKEQSVITPVSE